MTNMENARTATGALSAMAGGPIAAQFIHVPANIHRAANAISVGLHLLPDARGLALILRARLGLERRLWLAAACLWSLEAETAEALAEATLNDLQCGPPGIPFLDVRNEARDWADWASPGELRAYMAACWNRLSDRDRQTFIRRAIA